ncbi:L-seryl-tRNA(Sec) selenium transferase [Desulfosporosinus nitroreducens]|uniref:L-seryl-tRNA(Sec) selenium transferase n=1 Tax=Desulfosporosinus nitroreducens TaxID=2018668 RepID=UPI00207CB766|nr:L-seryl-tRNA(Sec) selenium transferase [Desulfosporosinus nitroreducens]MCO1602040.1 L-seryl-tRNA(Sec) selenium transferase [Desulfosporosinus nitroreducens]
MEEKQALLRALPKVDDLLRRLSTVTADMPGQVVKRVVQEQIDLCRHAILDGNPSEVGVPGITDRILTALGQVLQCHLRGVINATGVILHTNLGRARLSDEAMETLTAAATGYSNLEYDLESGERGSRYAHVEALLTEITGAEAALVVNNNAAAVYLILDTLAKGTEVIVSRGELVEIGGSFRVPNIMAHSGCKLVEVGTTNKTHPADYANAIKDETGALLKVHTSNYRIVGFTQEVPLTQLWEIGQENRLPVIYDLGSGLLAQLEDYGIRTEPTVAECVPYADVLCFSGDKLLGGPQAGIIVGSKALVDRMKKNHLLRALRIDKLTLAALEYTLRQYLDPDNAVKSIPTLRMITSPVSEMEAKAKMLISLLEARPDVHYSIMDTLSQIGGGSLPDVTLASCAVGILSDRLSANAMEERLRMGNPPVIARVSQDSVLLDMRTVDGNEIPTLAACLNHISKT